MWGYNHANDRARVFPIPDEILLGGRINFYGVIKEYLGIRMKIDSATNRFFMGLKTTGRGLTSSDPKQYFTKQPLGMNSFNNIVKNLCLRLGVRGDGAFSTVTTHGLRATMVTLLIDAGYDDAIITLRTGHRDVKSLRNYHNLRGNIGLNQLKCMFGDSRDHVENNFIEENGILVDENVKKMLLTPNDMNIENEICVENEGTACKIKSRAEVLPSEPKKIGM